MDAERRRTLVADGRGVRMVDAPVPSCQPTEVLVRVVYSLVSPGTERHYVAQLAGGADELPLGYCAVGTVVACGAEVDHVAPGALVIAMGWTLATHSTHVVVPRRLVAAVGSGIRPEHALLATLGATAVHAADRAALIAADRVLVVGLGPVGVLVAMVAADRGCEVWAWDRDPARRVPAPFWRVLDPAEAPPELAGGVTAVLLCVDGDLGALVGPVLPLLHPDGNGARRSRIVNVGRATGTVTLAPATGNIDLINAARCGAGYRDDAYHHGRRDVTPPPGEHTVAENLARALAVVARHSSALDALERTIHTPAEALTHYNAPSFFPPGLHLIDHGPR